MLVRKSGLEPLSLTKEVMPLYYLRNISHTTLYLSIILSMSDFLKYTLLPTLQYLSIPLSLNLYKVLTLIPTYRLASPLDIQPLSIAVPIEHIPLLRVPFLDKLIDEILTAFLRHLGSALYYRLRTSVLNTSGNDHE